MSLIALMLSFAVPLVSATVPAKITKFTAPSGFNEVMFVQGQPLIWGVNPGGNSDFYEHILSRADGKIFKEWKLPTFGQLNEWGESRYDVFLDAIGSPLGVLNLNVGDSRQPLAHFEFIDFLSGQIRRVVELQPRVDCWTSSAAELTPNGPLYIKAQAGVLYSRFCPISNSNNILSELVNLTTGQSFTATFKFSDPTTCSLIPNERPAAIQDLTAVCWPKDWIGSAQSITAHSLIGGKTVWSAPIPADLMGRVIVKQIWHVSGRDAALMFDLMGGGNSGFFLLPAGPVKQPIRLDQKPDYGYMNWHPQIGTANGTPVIFGVLRDGRLPLSLNLTTGRVSALSYVPWRVVSSPNGAVYAVAPSADEKSFSIINTESGAVEATFGTPYDQDSLWGDHDSGRTRSSIFYGEARDGAYAAADRIVFWAAEPATFESLRNEITVIEIPFP